MNSFKTPKGTVLPLLQLKSKDYLQVAHRLVWFREEHPDWTISTEMVEKSDKHSIFKATISDSSGRVLATAHKFENAQGFPDFIEKSETGSIGRCCALVGYGTQFCSEELDEGNRLADSPLQPVQGPSSGTVVLSGPTSEGKWIQQPPADGGDGLTPPEMFLVTFGKYSKPKATKLGDIISAEIVSYSKFLVDSAEKDGKPMGKGATAFVELGKQVIANRIAKLANIGSIIPVSAPKKWTPPVDDLPKFEEPTEDFFDEHKK